MRNERCLIAATALGLDAGLGDPPNRFHPVAWMGTVIAKTKPYAPEENTSRLGFGTAVSLGGAGFSFGLGWLAERITDLFPRPLAMLVQGYLLKLVLSARGLRLAASEIEGALLAADLDEARRLLHWHLVSRETKDLTEAEVCAAAIESVAENTSDGVVGPLYYYLMGGLGAAWAYRFSNTVDSMWGYRNEEFEWLGKFPARWDDLLNFIPSRLTAMGLAIGGWWTGKDAGRGLRVWHRDHGLTSSPNAGHPMSMMAGLLDVELEKNGHYRLGAGSKAAAKEDIQEFRADHAEFDLGFAGGGFADRIGDEIEWREARERMIQPRAEIVKTSTAHHGAPDYTELEILGISPDEVLDFSVNSNPYGPSPRVREILNGVPLERYPDRDSVVLRRMLSRRFNMHPNRIMVGNGTSELIQMVCFAYLERGDRVLALAHTFGEYQRAASLMGAHFFEFQTSAEDGFQVDAAELGKTLAEREPKIFFLCNPNNPTGAMLPAAVIHDLVRGFPQTLFAVDEAYMAFADTNKSVICNSAANLLVLRSVTKDYALAGLRLGYVVGSMDVIDALQRARPAWNVNAMAQAAGLAAIGDEDYLQQTLEKLRIANLEFRDQLVSIGAELVPSSVHYFLMKVGNAAACRSELLKAHIQVRDCFSFELSAYVRIATKQPEENSRLIAVLGDIQKRRGKLIF